MRCFLVSSCLIVISSAQLDLFKGLLGSGISTSGENNPFSKMMSSILNPDSESTITRRPMREREFSDEEYDESDRDLLRRRYRTRERSDIFRDRQRSHNYNRENEFEGANSNPLGSLLGSGTGTADTTSPFNLGGLFGRK